MAKQYVYNVIPAEQSYEQSGVLYQYQPGSNPLHPLGLQGAQYTFVDASQNSTNTQTISTYPNIAYTTNVKQQIYLDKNQAYSQPGHNPAHLKLYQTDHKIIQDTYHQTNPYQIQNNQITQPQIKQNQTINQQAYAQQNMQVNPQIYVQNPSHHYHHYQNQQIYPQIQLKQPQNKIQQQKPPQQQSKQIIQPKINPQIQQKLPNQQNNQIIQQQINPQVQQKLPHQHNKQIIQQQINPQIQQKLPQQQRNKQIIQPQFNPQIQEKLPQNQQYQHQNQKQIVQPQVQPKLQPSNINSNIQQKMQQQIQQQKPGLTPQQIQYQNYNQKQNLNQNEHFVNQPIYQVQNPVIEGKNSPNLASTLPLPNINSGTVNNNTEILKKTSKLNPKHFETSLSKINEEEFDITQSGFSKKISLIDNSNADIKEENKIEEEKENENENEKVKESPMEEKQPEAALPNNIMEDNMNNNNQQSITESGISDYDSQLDHLPTINSIMKGNHPPLPPSKKKKYKD